MLHKVSCWHGQIKKNHCQNNIGKIIFLSHCSFGTTVNITCWYVCAAYILYGTSVICIFEVRHNKLEPIPVSKKLFTMNT